MKRLLFILMCLPLTCHAVAVSSAAIASGVAVAVASQEHNRAVNNQQQMLLANTKGHASVIGVMTCHAHYINIPGLDAYDMFGCGDRSIKEFFDKNKRSDKYEIIQIIYNDHANIFLIYYGLKEG